MEGEMEGGREMESVPIRGIHLYSLVNALQAN